MIDTDRAVRACRDVLAVEMLAPGMCRVVTLGGAYTVDARGEGCTCPDKEYNLGEGEMCKHHAAALLATDDTLPTPFLVRESLTDRQDPAFDLEVPDRIGNDRQLSAFVPDGGECEACARFGDGFPCAACFTAGDADLPEVDA